MVARGDDDNGRECRRAHTRCPHIHSDRQAASDGQTVRATRPASLSRSGADRRLKQRSDPRNRSSRRARLLPQPPSPRKNLQDHIRAIGDADFRKDMKLVSQGRIDHAKPFILADPIGEVVPALVVLHIDLRPWWRKEHILVVSSSPGKPSRKRLAGQAFQGARSIDQSPVEEYPTGSLPRMRTIRKRQSDRATGEPSLISPWQGRPAARQLLRNNAAARLFNDVVATVFQGVEQRGFAAAGTSGDHHEVIVIRH